MLNWGKFFKKNKPRRSSLPLGLRKLLGFSPTNQAVFEEAFTHRSSQLNDTEGNRLNYERLEFLGDAMLSSVISNYLYKKVPNQKEGYLTQMRSKIVSRKHLNEVGKKLGLMHYLCQIKLKKEALSPNVHGDLFESLVGAIFVDQGYKVCEDFIYKTIIKPYVDIQRLENRIASYKSLLLEWSQKNKVQLRFETRKEDNAEEAITYVSVLFCDHQSMAKGRGSSKKKAEENAAKRTYYQLKSRIEGK